MRVAILGTGSWGTALAKVLVDNQQEVMLWGRNQAIVDEVNTHHTNQDYLPNIILPNAITATINLQEAITKASIILVVIPTKGIRAVMNQLKEVIQFAEKNPIIVHASKGIEPETQLRISQMIEESLARNSYEAIAVLSGPSHAEEVAQEQLTTLTVASDSKTVAETVQDVFMTPYFRVYTNSDVIGVELGGSLKNIIAIGAGIITGLGYGDNTKAALMTRGLAEISRLGVEMGADPLTFSGLSGMGDLIVTCTSIHSRNFRAGQLLAQGLSLEEVEEEIRMVVEGIATCKAVYQLAGEQGVEMPITNGLYQLIYEDAPLEEGIERLMLREGKAEISLNTHMEND